MLGTILPTRESLAADDEHAARQEAEQLRIGATLRGQRRVVGGEVRYYYAARRYAIVGRDFKIKRFEERKDGDYSVCD